MANHLSNSRACVTCPPVIMRPLHLVESVVQLRFRTFVVAGRDFFGLTTVSTVAPDAGHQSDDRRFVAKRCFSTFFYS
jgi:hypothetical protein